jgi:hypothetical protein
MLLRQQEVLLQPPVCLARQLMCRSALWVAHLVPHPCYENESSWVLGVRRLAGNRPISRSPTATPSARTGAARNQIRILETWIRARPARKTVPLTLDNRDSCTPARADHRATPGSPPTNSATQCAFWLAVPRGPDLFRQWLTDRKKKRPGPSESRGGYSSR